MASPATGCFPRLEEGGRATTELDLPFYRKEVVLISKRLAAFTCAVMFAGFGISAGAASASSGTLNGAGSTLVAPLAEEWAAAWGNITGNTVNYDPVGSGKGYTDIANGLVDFGASDAPLSVYSTPRCQSCVQIPWAISAVGVTYHLAGISRLRLTGPVIAQIYLGHITNWDDHRIADLNRGLHLPNLRIAVFWRSDGSGTTYAFSRYLSDVSSTFAHQVGASTTVSFPVGAGAKGNSGMAAAAASTNGAIAYIEVAYLINDRLPAAYIKNQAGRWIVPNLSAIEAAAKLVHSIPSSNQINIINSPRRAKSAYPIATFTYAIAPTTAPQGSLLRKFLSWCVTQGQSFGPRLDFTPIPKFVQQRDLATIKRIN